MWLVLSAWLLLRSGPRGAPYRAVQSDLDALMKRVLAQRDENWKKLQQYILEEHVTVDVRNATSRVWGERREFQWFLRDGYFIRSPLKVNGMTVPEASRRAEEEDYFRRAKARDDPSTPGDPRGSLVIGPAGVKFTPGRSREPQDDGPADVSGLIQQRRQPEFIESAYFFKFRFEEGKYAFVGRERVDGRELLRIEYYPSKLFDASKDSRSRNDPPTPGVVSEADGRRPETERERLGSDAFAQIMNKASLVTLWIDPGANQIVKYTFTTLNVDAFSGAWAVRLREFKASMTMSQPFKDAWLPRDVDFVAGATLATGPIGRALPHRISELPRGHRDWQNQEMTLVRWGIVGCGDVTEVKSGPGFQKADGSELVAVMRRDRAKAEDYARRHGVPRVHATADALIDDPDVDAVYIATPPSSHCELALRVAAAGKPCLVEKPMARTHAECVEMIDAFRQRSVPLWVAYYRRALPRFLKVRELLREGAIGRVTALHIDVSDVLQPAADARLASRSDTWPARACSSISPHIASTWSISSPAMSWRRPASR